MTQLEDEGSESDVVDLDRVRADDAIRIRTSSERSRLELLVVATAGLLVSLSQYRRPEARVIGLCAE